MTDPFHRAVAIVGVGTILPDAPDTATYWQNLVSGRDSIREVDPRRWDPALYWDPDPHAPDKTYSKIGGWVREFRWDPRAWKLAVPPRVSDAMDEGQRWAVSATRQVLDDYGKALDGERTAVILGNAMGGEKHYLTAMRIAFPEFAALLEGAPAFQALPEAVRRTVRAEWHARVGAHFPEIYEDTMPGELSNVTAGRIANLFDLHGANYTTDAACASALAALSAAVDGLVAGHFDAVVTGGVDRNMGASSFVKFCKIGALSATGSRPYADGADGFVMGEGCALFLLRRLADAERDGDRIYAVIRGVGASSDGRGKGITAPNPAGQKYAVERAWRTAGLDPRSASYFEGHGTSTRVGDVAELTSLRAGIDPNGTMKPGSIPVGSVKSNFGHLKGAAGAAGLLKATLALHHKTLPISLHAERPNPNFEWASAPFRVNTATSAWETPACGVRRAGVSAFGFGGTNFHVVVEEYQPGRLRPEGKTTVAVSAPAAAPKRPLRGALVVGGANVAELTTKLQAVQKASAEGRAPAPVAPSEADLRAPERIAIDYGTPAELADRAGRALKGLGADAATQWKALRAQGVFRGHGPAPKVAFLYTGQGSQYLNMLAELRAQDRTVAEVFERADRVMTPLLGRPLTSFVYADPNDKAAVGKAEEELRQTAITQPAILATDEALTRLFAGYGVVPDLVMGHSLGEYGALVAAGALPFEDALEAVSARGREMTRVSVADNGKMAAVFGPLAQIEKILATLDGYVVIANKNSHGQAVIGGASYAVERASAAFQEAGFTVVPLPVSHAFHTSIVAPASEPLKNVLRRLRIQAPQLPVVANVNGQPYPMHPGARDEIVDILGRQIASPVEFVKGLETLYDLGARVFVEVGPKKALQGFVEDVLGRHADVLAVYSNHPKTSDTVAFNQALCAMYAAGLGVGEQAVAPVVRAEAPKPPPPPPAPSQDAIARIFRDALEKGLAELGAAPPAPKPEPVVVMGASLGLPGGDHMFGDDVLPRLLEGRQMIDVLPTRLREAIAQKRITRLVKSDEGARFETIDDVHDVIKLAGRRGAFDLAAEYGVDAERIGALDEVTRLAMAAGLDALRDAGVPLVLRYKTTTKGTRLPDRWVLPEALRDETGIIFASAFPGYDTFAAHLEAAHEDAARRERVAELSHLRARLASAGPEVLAELDHRLAQARHDLEQHPYAFDRRFLFQILAMGHSQFAELIGARGPNTQVNAACASTTQAVAIAEDWLRGGRCRRVIVIAADNATSEHLMEWIGAGFLASGAAATDEVVADAATPFDRRRHGMIIGMGAAAFVLETAATARERGVAPITELYGTQTHNSAFHGTRLDVEHIAQMMENVVATAEARSGVDRHEMARSLLFISHETYTPARGGSASAEIASLRRVFGASVDRIVIANTKGYTGHPMGAGIEDVLAVKALETGLVPAVPNFKEPDPELGPLNLSQGGAYPVRWALRLAAGFGSQIALTVSRWVPPADGRRRTPEELGFRYRIVDAGRWSAWLERLAGRAAELEVVHRTLRVREPDGAKPPSGAAGGGSAGTASGGATVTAAATASAPAISAAAKTVPPSVATAATVPTVPAVAKAPPPPPVVEDPVRTRVLALVTEKTGYPPEMLDPGLDLEADLGIDTVKQAELITAIRAEWEIPRDDALRLRDYPTLEAVIGFVYAKRPDLAKPAASSAPAATAGPAPGVAAVASPVAASASDAGVGAGSAAAGPPSAGAPPSSPGSVPSPGSTADDPVRTRVLALVTEKTGYPPEMLDPELDLEADLGIDTVKQAELIAAIRAEWDIPRDDALKLRDYPTLEAVIGFVYAKRPDLAPGGASTALPASGATGSTPGAASAVSPLAGAPAPVSGALVAGGTSPVGAPVSAPAAGSASAAAGPVAPSAPPAASSALADDPVRTRVLALVTEKTGYPPEMLDPELDLEADLGIDTVKQAELIGAIRAEWDIPRDDALRLQDYPTLEHIVRFVYAKRPDLAPSTTAAELAPGAASGAAPMPTSASPAPLAAPPGGATSAMAPASASSPAASGGGAPHGSASSPSSPAEDPAAASPGSASSPSADDPVRTRILALVTEKTGYPPEMLDLELDLEADLGIDTVKQAELIGAIRAEWDIPRDDALRLQDYPTLAHIVRFVYAKRPDLAGAPAAPVRETPVAPPPPVVAAAPRRVPVPVLRPATCLPTGVTVGPGTRVLVAATPGGPSEAVATALRALLAARGAAVVAPGEPGPLDGVYWLRGLDPVDLGTLDLAGWRDALRIRVKDLYATMRGAYETSPFLVSAVALDGLHGYGPHGARNPLGGAVTGFTKTWARERPTAVAKAVDFVPGTPTEVVAAALLAETEVDPGAVEVGHRDGRRWGIGLVEAEAGPVQSPLTPDRVFLVTGAAGSIVSAITADLARACGGGTFYLLDLTPEPAPDDPDLRRFVSDRDGLRKDLFERLKARGERATPAVVDKLLAGLERSQAARAAIDAVVAAGGRVRWFSGDLRDPATARAAVSAARAEVGRIDFLLHAAGLEISRLLPDKKPEEFDLVFDVKADGWFNLVSAGLPFGTTLAFSSIAGRFGNGGQADYASANDLLCKLAAAAPPGTRGLSIDWTAWGGIGMATRGSIPKVLAAAGIEMLDPDVGLATVRRELTSGTGETVAAGRLGMLMATRASIGAVPPGPMLGRVVSFDLYDGLVVEVELDPKVLPFLDHHRIDGTAVLPGVMGVEAFVEAAKALVPDAPTWTVEGVEFLAPFKFYRDAPRVVTVHAMAGRDDDGTVVVDCRLVGRRMLHGHTEPEVTEHFRGRVRFGTATPAKAKVPKLKKPVDAQAIYRVFFHGPAYRVLDGVARAGDDAVALLAAVPEDGAAGAVATPRLLEAAFQAAGAVQIAVTGTMGLPSVLGSATWTPTGEPARAVLVRGGPETFDAQVVDAAGAVVLTVTGYRTATLGPIDDVSRAPFAAALSR